MTMATSSDLQGIASQAKRQGTPTLARRPSGVSAPMSFGQKQLWFFYRLLPQSPAYNVFFALKLDRKLDVAVLERAVNEIVRRHEILRTCFAVVDGEPVQVIELELSLTVEREDLAGIAAEKRAAVLRRRLEEEAGKPINLERLPLLRIKLFDLEPHTQVFFMLLPHILWDGWSQEVFSRELEMLYAAYSKNENSPLGELPVQYGDYAYWQLESFKQGHLDAVIEYWRKQLAGVPQTLELPTDYPRPTTLRFEGSYKRFEVSETITKSLKELGRKSQATLYMTVLAAYAVLLHRYSRQEQLLIGTPLANRSLEELQKLIGFFFNTIVMRVELKAGLRFTELLKRVKETALAAYAHQELPFELLVERLQPERSLNRMPLIQTMFLMQGSSQFASENKFFTGTPIRFEVPANKLDLSLSMRERDGKLSAEFNYDTSLFSSQTIQRFQDNFLFLLEEISKDASLRVIELSCTLSHGEQEEIQTWNSTRIDYKDEELLHVLVEKQVRSSPGRLALIYENQKLTYLELDRRANQLAHHLRKLGIGPEKCVGICMERSMEMVVALLGILKAGGAYLPLDPEYPHERLQWMANDARLPVILAQERFAHKFDQSEGRKIICLDRCWAAISQEPDYQCNSAVSGENVAYVIYTSGSTGKPKGVMNRHRGICNRLLWMENVNPLNQLDRIFQKTTYTFDVSVCEVFWPLMAGACLVMAKPGGHRDSSYLREIIQKEKITVMHFVPSMLRSMLEDEALRDCFTLKRVICTGEAVDLALAAQFHRQCQADLYNMYGPTEAAVEVTHWLCEHDTGRSTVPIGHPIANTGIYLLDRNLMHVPVLASGELCIGGEGLARGYLNRPDLTAEMFIPNPFGGKGSRLYRTGDLARFGNDGAIEYLGRMDYQVKIRGTRIELGEIEETLKQHEHVQDSAVLVHQEPNGEKRLAAFIVAKKDTSVEAQQLRTYLKDRLPEVMVPGSFVFLDKFPQTSNGKLDRKALLQEDSRIVSGQSREERPYLAPRNVLEEKIAQIWARVLRVERVGVHDNFFDLGGHSLGLLQVHSELKQKLQIDLPVLHLFRFPTVASIVRHLSPEKEIPAHGPETHSSTQSKGSSIAIIGMAGRFPGARNIEEFWENLKNGVESISFFSGSEDSDVPEAVRCDPNYVRAGAVLEDADFFDAGFFGFHSREAQITDPQQRVFLECAWELLERSGYDPERYRGAIGVFAGMSASGYWFQLSRNAEVKESVNSFQLTIGNDKDHLPLRVSYKLNLRGPSLSVQTTCSTSLVAVHMACQSLLQGECKMAMAGGVSIRANQKSGYLYQEGGIASPDGHCRTFDAGAAGTVTGNGAGVVLLKRLEDALADGDHIHAVILGSAINNDGAFKVGYTAPSIEGQAEVIAQAQAKAGVPAESITYIEAHGTATPLGDPIEIAALTQAFRLQTEKKQFCAIGSVKTNLGHLDTAAGVASLIKTVLALEHRWLPPSLHFKNPNPKIDFAASPFYVNSELREWMCDAGSRRAGVSSFGIGGTNAHVVLEEAPLPESVAPETAAQLLVLSCRSERALQTASQQLTNHLRKHPEQNIRDIAFTLQEGRREFLFRRAIVCHSGNDAAQAIESVNSQKTISASAETTPAPVYFLFPGQGAQRVNMARGLYESVPVFRRQVDRCAAILRPHLRSDLLALLYPEDKDSSRCQEELRQTANAQPALFVIEYALASLWMELGVQCEGMLGHSLGEYAAACVAGVISLEDALRLVAVRGQLMQNMPPGAMLSVPAPEHVIKELLKGKNDIALAAVNGPSLCVVSGSLEAVLQCEAQLAEQGLEAQRLHTSHAFHSPMMAPVAGPLMHLLKGMKLKAPSIPFLSNLTGGWITEEEATSPDYWLEQMLHTVRFSDNLQHVLERSSAVLLEMGPETLSILAKRHPDRRPETSLVASMQSRKSTEEEYSSFLHAVGALWAHGQSLTWHILRAPGKYRRVVLPTYPFERQSYNIPVPEKTMETHSTLNGNGKLPEQQVFQDVYSQPKNGAESNATSAAHQLVLQQLQIIEKQLELLRQRV